MTRINLVHPSQLTNKHLMAEYRELPRIFTAVRKLQEEGKTLDSVDIPERYVLGKGHMKFFYNKLKWLNSRYEDLYLELEKRGYDLNEDQYNSIRRCVDDKLWGTEFWGYWWSPSPEDVYLNMIRICKRSNIDEVLQEIHD